MNLKSEIVNLIILVSAVILWIILFVRLIKVIKDSEQSNDEDIKEYLQRIRENEKRRQNIHKRRQKKN